MKKITLTVEIELVEYEDEYYPTEEDFDEAIKYYEKQIKIDAISDIIGHQYEGFKIQNIREV